MRRADATVVRSTAAGISRRGQLTGITHKRKTEIRETISDVIRHPKSEVAFSTMISSLRPDWVGGIILAG